MRLEAIVVGHLRLVGAGAIGQRLAIPEGRAMRGEDRPAHAGEAAHEEVAGRFHDVMVRLEPGDERRLAIGRHNLLEAHEGMHLVDVAVDGLGHRARRVDIGVARVVEEARSLAQPPQQPVEQREPLGIGMDDDLAGERDEDLGDVEDRLIDRRRTVRDLVGGEEIAARVSDLPDDPLGRNAGQHRRAGGTSPAVEVGLRGKGDAVHRQRR